MSIRDMMVECMDEMETEMAQRKVFAALAAAAENGFDMAGMTADEIAEDLNRHCSDVEGLDHSRLVHAVRRWKEGRAV